MVSFECLKTQVMWWLQVVDIGEGGELLNAVQELPFLPGFNLEGFPNRDSTPYAKLYNIENAKTIIRGTLRYKVRHRSLHWISNIKVHEKGSLFRGIFEKVMNQFCWNKKCGFSRAVIIYHDIIILYH